MMVKELVEKLTDPKWFNEYKDLLVERSVPCMRQSVDEIPGHKAYTTEPLERIFVLGNKNMQTGEVIPSAKRKIILW